jgi:hypothetical protein
VYAHLFGHVLDHHGAQVINPMVEEIGLAPDDGLAHADDGVLPLLDILDELDRGSKTFFDVIPHFPRRAIRFQHAAVGKWPFLPRRTIQAIGKALFL